MSQVLGTKVCFGIIISSTVLLCSNSQCGSIQTRKYSGWTCAPFARVESGTQKRAAAGVQFKSPVAPESTIVQLTRNWEPQHDTSLRPVFEKRAAWLVLPPIQNLRGTVTHHASIFQCNLSVRYSYLLKNTQIYINTRRKKYFNI